MQFHQLLEPVIAIDDAAVEIVEIGGSKAPAIERHQGPKLGRKHGNHVQDHPLGLIAALAERVHHPQPLGVLDTLLQAGVRLHFFAQFVAELIDIDVAQELFDRFGAHRGAELPGIFGLQFAEFFFRQELAFLDARHFTRFDHNEGLEIENALEIAHGDIEQVADARGQAFEEPHVRTGRSQFDMAQPLAAHFAERDFDAALIADHAAMLHALVFPAQAFPIRHGAEDFRAEQAVALGLEGAVVNGLRLGDFAMGPGTDLFRTRETDTNGIEIRDQTGTVIRAATIQGFLPPCRGLSRGAPGRPGSGTRF